MIRPLCFLGTAFALGCSIPGGEAFSQTVPTRTPTAIRSRTATKTRTRTPVPPTQTPTPTPTPDPIPRYEVKEIGTGTIEDPFRPEMSILGEAFPEGSQFVRIGEGWTVLIDGSPVRFITIKVLAPKTVTDRLDSKYQRAP